MLVTTQLSYRELQTELKNYRARGHNVECKLNATKSVLQAEYIRVYNMAHAERYTQEQVCEAEEDLLELLNDVMDEADSIEIEEIVASVSIMGSIIQMNEQAQETLIPAWYLNELAKDVRHGAAIERRNAEGLGISGYVRRMPEYRATEGVTYQHSKK